jgi:hypothetical protein
MEPALVEIKDNYTPLIHLHTPFFFCYTQKKPGGHFVIFQEQRRAWTIRQNKPGGGQVEIPIPRGETILVDGKLLKVWGPNSEDTQIICETNGDLQSYSPLVIEAAFLEHQRESF